MRKKLLAATTFLFFISLFLSPISGQQTFVQGQVLVLSVQVLDELGNPVEGTLVHFYDETDGVEIGEDYSDAEGFASVIWNTSLASIGKHKLHIWNDEDPSIFVERSDTYVEVKIVSPAELTLSITSPSAVKPGEEFEIRVKVSNIGGASALFVEASVNGISKNLGNITGGSVSETSFRVRAQNAPGNYTLKVVVNGQEQSTGRRLFVSKTISYKVKRRGIGLSIGAPDWVEEGSTFDFTVLVENLGEDLLSFTLRITLDGASPHSIRRSGSIEAYNSLSFEFSAQAKAKDKIIIVAEAKSGDLREKRVKEIKVVSRSLPRTTAPQSSPRPSSKEKIKEQSGQNLSEVANITEATATPTYNLTENNQSAYQIEEVTGEENISLGTIKERGMYSGPIISPLIVATCILILFSALRRLWKVEKP